MCVIKASDKSILFYPYYHYISFSLLFRNNTTIPTDPMLLEEVIKDLGAIFHPKHYLIMQVRHGSINNDEKVFWRVIYLKSIIFHLILTMKNFLPLGQICVVESS